MQISNSKMNISKPILGKIDRESGGSLFIKGKSILLIDDEPMVTDICEMMLKRLGLKVLTAHSGSDGIKIYEAHKNRIDLIISDYDMPGMNGKEVVDKLRVMGHRVKVLLSSGGLNQEQEEEVLGWGFNGFLKKPFNTNTLSEKIADLLM